MDKKKLFAIRRQAVDLCMVDGVMLTPENIINALDELGYLHEAAQQKSVQSDAKPSSRMEQAELLSDMVYANLEMEKASRR